MGFHEDYVIPVSDTQAYRQFGNSIVVPVVKEIASSMSHVIEQYGLADSSKLNSFATNLWANLIPDDVLFEQSLDAEVDKQSLSA